MAFYFRYLFFFMLMTVVIILAAGCGERPVELEIGETEILAESGERLLHIDDIPENIQVDNELEFGASARFTDAKLSPAGRWIAAATVGVAHGAGWVFDVETGEVIPASFQYGGSVEIGPWSDAGRFVAFIEKSPAPTNSLSIIDLNSPGSTIAESAVPIRISAHSDSVPQNTTYKPIEWDGDILIFEVDGETLRYNAIENRVLFNEPDPSSN